MKKESYSIDRTQVSAMSFNEANDHVSYWLTKTEDERLNAACFLINQLYGVTPYTKVDRTVTDKRKFS
jgi:hypothetical protein